MSYYNYEELREKAINGGFEEKEMLYQWFVDNCEHGEYWNGECYDLGEGLSLYPVYGEEVNEQYDIIDFEIR